jgi:hypothetical protein
MPLTVLIHLMSEDPIVAEMDKAPEASDQFLICENPRRRDGQDLSYVLPEIRSLIIPIHRIHSVEILPGGEKEKVVTFVRE